MAAFEVSVCRQKDLADAWRTGLDIVKALQAAKGAEGCAEDTEDRVCASEYC